VVTGSFVYLTCAFLWRRNLFRDRGSAIFLAIYGSMQWVDASLWIYFGKQDTLDSFQCDVWNEGLTFFAFFVVLLEPVSSLVCSAMFSERSIKVYEWLVYLIIFIAFPASDLSCKEHNCSIVTPQGHISWFSYDLNRCSTMYLQLPESKLPIQLFIFLLACNYPYVRSSFAPYPSSFDYTKKCLYFSSAVHSCIIALSWLTAYFTDSHANMWCFCNLAQGLYMIIEPYVVKAFFLFPGQELPRPLGLRLTPWSKVVGYAFVPIHLLICFGIHSLKASLIGSTIALVGLPLLMLAYYFAVGVVYPGTNGALPGGKGKVQ